MGRGLVLPPEPKKHRLESIEIDGSIYISADQITEDYVIDADAGLVTVTYVVKNGVVAYMKGTG
jgi:hypothetical protein